MKINNWATIEEKVHRAMALEVISNSFPVLDRRSLNQLDDDANRVASSLKGLPADFAVSDLERLVQELKPPLQLSYHESLSRTIASMIATDQSSLIEFAVA